MEFKKWLMEALVSEAIVKTSNVGEAMKKTLEFNVNAEWIKLEVEKKGWISDRGVHDSYDLAGAFYVSKIPKPAFFFLRSFAIVEKQSEEYESKIGMQGLKIQATLFLFSGKTGMVPPGGVPNVASPKSLGDVLDKYGHAQLSERGEKNNQGNFIEKLDGPALDTPVQLAEWVNQVVQYTDLDSGDDNDDDTEEPKPDPFLDPNKKRLIKV